ncbi:uncharacterized protein LOC129908286 [Episyrphus balteatus]|uniref:uncharacterized protein LOC129908286 n=1 Tax=Episyrphus balteatus TaxID=286459 RepID=UPI002485974F|nr:uncharacterized protein LOC129908286 [Episyrphus balteatus]
MAFKFVTICALFAIANAGGLLHPVTYTQVHNIAADDAHHQPQYSHVPEGSHIHYVPAYAKAVHIAAPVHSGPVYAAPAYTHVTYGANSYARSLEFNEGQSSTPSSHSSEETTTTTEPTTTESTTTEAESAEEATHAPRSSEPEPTQAAYQHEPATSPGYRYDAPSASSPSSSANTHSSSGLPTFYKTSLHHAAGHHVAAPSFVKYEVPAQTVVKYAAPTHFAAAGPHQTLVHYSAPVQTVYHKTVAPQTVHVKYASPEPAVYTSFGEHPPAVYSHHSAPVHHTYSVQQPSLIKYTAPVQAPGQVTYVQPAPAVYTKYGATESTSHASHVAPAPTAYIKYGSSAPITHTTYVAPQHHVEASSTKLIKYDGPAAFNNQYESSTHSQSQPSSNEENKDTVEVESPESTTPSHQASRAYLPPATHLVSQTYLPAEHQYNSHQESARSQQSNEHNLWSTDGAASHVSFKGFGTSFAY